MREAPTDVPDPEPGDFDAELEAISDEDLEFVEAGSGLELAIEVIVAGEDAKRLAELADERGQSAREVVSSLLRST